MKRVCLFILISALSLALPGCNLLPEEQPSLTTSETVSYVDGIPHTKWTEIKLDEEARNSSTQGGCIIQMTEYSFTPYNGTGNHQVTYFRFTISSDSSLHEEPLSNLEIDLMNNDFRLSKMTPEAVTEITPEDAVATCIYEPGNKTVKVVVTSRSLDRLDEGEYILEFENYSLLFKLKAYTEEAW